MPFPAVELFVKPDSPPCAQLREYLIQQDVPFTEFDVEGDAQARTRLLWLTGKLWVPTLVVERDAIVGFDRSKLDELFEDIRERLAQAEESY